MLEAEILEDVEGALWTTRVIEASRRRDIPLDVVVIGVDPPAADPVSDEMSEGKSG
jgi:phage terminase large subunit-like protein